MDGEEPQDLSHIHWSWPEAIAANPARSLANADLAMDYFAFSPFWDSGSNNNVLRTQRRIEQPTYGSAEEKVELTAFRGGFEYVVAHARPPELFVIHRRPVNPDGTRGGVTHAYFILQDRVYMAPNLHHIVNTRLRNATSLIERTFDALERSHPPANPRAASVWRAGAPKEKEKEKAKEAEEEAKEAAGQTSQEGEKAEKGVKEKNGASKSQAAPDWHLFNALQATRAALPSLSTLASSSRPEHDVAAEAKTLEVLANASVRPNAPKAEAAPPTPLGGLAALGAPSPAVNSPAFGGGGTPLPGFTPRPRMGSISLLGGLGAGSKAGSNFAPSLPADSPQVS